MKCVALLVYTGWKMPFVLKVLTVMVKELLAESKLFKEGGVIKFDAILSL